MGAGRFIGRSRPLAVARASATLAALAGLVLTLSGPAAVASVPDAVATVTVTGTIENVVVDDSVPGTGTDVASQDAGTPVETFVHVEGELFDLPDSAPVPALASGQDVVITLEAAPGLTGTEALTQATDEVPGTEARVVEVLPVADVATPTDPIGATAGPSTAAAVLGAHTLTILPVSWTAPDVSTDTLTTLASQTADYWREQSGGRLSIATSVRGWQQIAAPGSCSSEGLTAMFNAAMAANPSVGSPTTTNHVLVYFPRYSACAFAGRASLLGGYIWDNGYTYADVAAHEVGHNLGLGHANLTTCTSTGARVVLSESCTKTEYGDYADVMGIAMSRASGNLNTAMADALGYANVTVIPAGTTSPVTVDLAPLAQVTSMRAVKIHVPAGDVYLDFRPAAGRDVRMPTWAGVQAHLRTIDGWGVSTTYLLDLQPARPSAFAAPALPAGAIWVVPGTGLLVTVNAVGSTATVQVAPDIGLERYVNRVYGDLFGRVPDPQGLQTWSRALRAGTARVEVANAITSSTEYRGGLIGGAYAAFLGRAPEPAGLQDWLVQMTRGMTIEQMEGGFVASQEFYNQAGANDAEWVRHLYLEVLGRTAAPSEVEFWTARVGAPAVGRYGVAMGFLLSTERLTTVIDNQYVHLLGRSIDPSGRQTWVGQIQGGVRLEAVIGSVIASEEYFART